MKAYIIFFVKLLTLLIAAACVTYVLFGGVWGVLLGPIALFAAYFGGQWFGKQLRRMKLANASGTVAQKDKTGFSYRDLNHNGKLDIYEDPRQPIEARIEDLLGQMTIEEKTGLLFSPQMDVVSAEKIAVKGGFNFGGDVVYQLWKRKINTFAAMGSLSPREFARWQNAVQKAAECTRLGIPVTVASDPRHVFVRSANPLTTQKDEGVSQWPSSPGLGAIDDEALMERYGQITRSELRAMGIRFLLNPVADTATEPRWPRVIETFGADAERNGRLAAAYIRGVQGEQLDKNSVACCIKHFPGGGPQKNGDDPHFAFGKEQVYPTGQFNTHMNAFRPAIANGVAAVMPYYGVPKGVEGIEEVGFNFNKTITHKLLREELGFKGMVHTDYSIIEGVRVFGLSCIPGRAWGIEKANYDMRLCRAFEAGSDQIGGESCSYRLARLVKDGKISESRLNESCRRVLELKFRLGLFDDPYVDESETEKICGCEEYCNAANDAMRRSVILLQNKNNILPLRRGIRIYTENIPREPAEKYAQIVDQPEMAEVNLIWADVPCRPDKRDSMAVMFQSGELTYTVEQKAHMSALMNAAPTVFLLRMTRPAVLPELKERAVGIIAECNVKPEILLETVFGENQPLGKLPYALPASMEAVLRHPSDAPLCEADACWPMGFGLHYKKETCCPGEV